MPELRVSNLLGAVTPWSIHYSVVVVPLSLQVLCRNETSEVYLCLDLRTLMSS